MTLLVTGSGGFVGSHLVEALLSGGADVRALVRYNGRNDWGHLEHLKPGTERLEVRAGDITDARLVDELVAECDVVYHLAALAGVPYSYQAPSSYVTTNVSGTLNVLEACRRQGVRRVVVTSTSDVYGPPQYDPIDEAHPLQAQSPYAASKIAAEKLAESYNRSFGLPAVVLRPFNTYGPRQSARTVIPAILHQALARRAPVIVGNLEPRRLLNYVGDTVRAFLLAADAPGIDGHTIHFGPSDSVSIGELAERCLDVTGHRADVRVDPERVRPEARAVERLRCDASRARELLGWEPTITLDEGLRLTAEYLAAHPDDVATEQYVR